MGCTAVVRPRPRRSRAPGWSAWLGYLCVVEASRGLTPGTVDYILFIKANVDLNPSPNEVRDTQYVTADKLKKLFEDPTLKFTPWFKLICNSMLFEWWEKLDSGLDAYLNEQEIRRM